MHRIRRTLVLQRAQLARRSQTECADPTQQPVGQVRALRRTLHDLTNVERKAGLSRNGVP